MGLNTKLWPTVWRLLADEAMTFWSTDVTRIYEMQRVVTVRLSQWLDIRYIYTCVYILLSHSPCVRRHFQFADFQFVLHPHIDYTLAVISQRVYLLNQLSEMSHSISGLRSVFSALIISRILFVLPAFYGLLSQKDIDQINAMFMEARRGFGVMGPQSCKIFLKFRHVI